MLAVCHDPCLTLLCRTLVDCNLHLSVGEMAARSDPTILIPNCSSVRA